MTNAPERRLVFALYTLQAIGEIAPQSAWNCSPRCRLDTVGSTQSHASSGIPASRGIYVASNHLLQPDFL